MTRAAIALALASCVTPWHAPAADAPHAQLVRRDAYLMGTLVRLAVYAPGRAEGLATLETALDVLEETEAELSTWRDDSAISMLNRAPIGAPWHASDRICRLFAALYAWHAATNGAFDPGIGSLTSAWGIHGDGRIPSRRELDDARRHAGLKRLRFDRAACTLTREADVTVDVGAFGKGEALDRAAAALGGTAWMIDLGGQLSVGGPRAGGEPWLADIAHPVERDRPLLQVRLSAGSLSTSGSSERDRRVNGQRVGHLLDPRTGAPAPFIGSVTVWHEQGLAADILSTALYVMGPQAGIAWAEARDLSACYLIPRENGRVDVIATQGFRRIMASHPDTR